MSARTGTGSGKELAGPSKKKGDADRQGDSPGKRAGRRPRRDRKERPKEDGKGPKGEGKGPDDGGEEPEKPAGGKAGLARGAFELARDILVSLGILLLVLGSLWAYCGVWPPMVVVESSSMMHGSDSQIGVIDTGDLTLVKAIRDRTDVVTMVEALNPGDPNHGFMTYGDYGSVIIYQKNGLAGTPIIHRAIAWIEYNATASASAGAPRGDIPDIGVYNAASYTLPYDVGFGKIILTIDLAGILGAEKTSNVPHGGFITLGDHNRGRIDQANLVDGQGRPVEPVRPQWVVGVAQGELPWLGLFKLWVSGQDTSTFPPSSSAGLVATIILLVAVPLAIDHLYERWKRKRGDRKDIRKGSRRESGKEKG